VLTPHCARILFVVERLLALLDERRLAILVRQHAMGKPKEGNSLPKLVAAYVRKAEESAVV
jgi:ParB family transcriptional regulator, chromosome partitioning protein